MSIEAIDWALNRAPIPRDQRNASTLAIVLVGLANHAGPDGRNAFPALSTLSRYTRLARRSVQNTLAELAELGLIRPADPEIVAAHVRRADRRPNGWDLALERSEHGDDQVIHSPGDVVHSPGVGVQGLHPDQGDGVQSGPNGVQTATSRGAGSAPEPSLNRPGTVLPPLCGDCDGRELEGVASRVIWLDEAKTSWVHCPRCNPHSPQFRSPDAGPPASSSATSNVTARPRSGRPRDGQGGRPRAAPRSPDRGSAPS
ncbi:helix-turn-helix domain-containing protein [Amycolatopsis anabasis]|uniref:helix-turn-helix domain-containing protein n=1 Tax=Amycolatopsis anabasis TaxID=1840409 RepID=UPI00131A66A4|nr:helix-turn-helix domain-containing protein [Amycolatopsis anabasis]